MDQEPKKVEKGATVRFFKQSPSWEVGTKFVDDRPTASMWDKRIEVPPTARVVYKKHSRYIETRVTATPSFPDGAYITILSLT